MTAGGVNLGGALPQGDGNGLAAIVRALLDRPEHIHVVIALIDTVKITTNVDSGDRIPTVRIRRIEAIHDGGDRDRLRMVLQREYERRTGRVALPFELAEEIERAFEQPTLDDADLDRPPDAPPETPDGTS